MSTTESIFRPDERRAKMMVERIPWQYKWEAGQSKPDWIRFGRDQGNHFYEDTSDVNWGFNDDGMLVYDYNESTRNVLNFIGNGYNTNYFQNGAIAEIEVHLENVTGSSYQTGLTFNAGSPRKGGARTDFFMIGYNHGSSAFVKAASGPYWSKGNVDLLPWNTIRWGFDYSERKNFISANGVYSKVLQASGTDKFFIGLAPKYVKGGSIFIRKVKVYTY